MSMGLEVTSTWSCPTSTGAVPLDSGLWQDFFSFFGSSLVFFPRPDRVLSSSSCSLSLISPFFPSCMSIFLHFASFPITLSSTTTQPNGCCPCRSFTSNKRQPNAPALHLHLHQQTTTAPLTKSHAPKRTVDCACTALELRLANAVSNKKAAGKRRSDLGRRQHRYIFCRELRASTDTYAYIFCTAPLFRYAKGAGAVLHSVLLSLLLCLHKLPLFVPAR